MRPTLASPMFLQMRGTRQMSLGLFASGITVGCGDGSGFCPSRDTTRGEMATFLYRAINDGVEDLDLDPLYPDPLFDGEFEQDRSLELSVYYCGTAGSYTENRLRERVDEMNRIIGPFIRRQSEFIEDITFVKGDTNGGLLSPSTISGVSSMRMFADADIHLDCLAETGRPRDTKIVILANVGSPGPSGYAPARGPAVAKTLEVRNFDLTGYMGTVAHEVLHAFYDLRHPWRTRTALCDVIEDEYDLMDIQKSDREYCMNNPSDEMLGEGDIDEMLWSIMSYTTFDSLRDIAARKAYVACFQRALDHLQWIDPNECDKYRASTPGRPSSPRVRSAIEALNVSWSAPDVNGADIDDYDVRFRALGSEDWIDWPHDGTSEGTTITGLTPGTTYRVSVQAVNRIGTGAWSAPGEGAPTIAQTREVILTRGASAQGEPGCNGAACFWLHVEIKNFPPGNHTLACAHEGVYQIGVSRGVYRSVPAAVSNNVPSTMDCFFGYPGNEVFVIVGAELRDDVWYGGTYSNGLPWDNLTPRDEIYNDNPLLVDNIGEDSWWRPPADIARSGYNGGFHFTLAIGNASDNELDNWARWDFDSVSDRYEIQAWIPAEWATAHVQYLIWADSNGDGTFSVDEYVDGPWLDQQTTSGWQTLGAYDLNGRVRIEVRDVRTRDDWNDVGAVYARLAVDAIRLVPKTTPRDEIYNDNPLLVDNIGEDSWWRPPADIARSGYNGGFHFTLAIGNASDNELDNWARWDFDSVSDRYEIQAWIPAEWATAHVQYLIWADSNGDGTFSVDEYVDGPWLDQQTTSGWQTLGAYDLNGRVRIEVRDVRTRDDWNDVGAVYARLAVDAIRLVRN